MAIHPTSAEPVDAICARAMTLLARPGASLDEQGQLQMADNDRGSDHARTIRPLRVP